MRKASTPTAAKPANHQVADNKDRLNQVLSIGLSVLSLNNESVGAPADKRKSEDEATEELPQAKVVARLFYEEDMPPRPPPPDVFQMDKEELNNKLARAKKEGYDEGKKEGYAQGYAQGKQDAYAGTPDALD